MRAFHYRLGKEMTSLTQREKEIAAITDDQRDEGDESNPILHAESGPNRFNVMSMFFPEEDGVRIEEHIGLNDIEVFYFDIEGKETQLEEGILFDWAINHYKENF